jgi:DNA mismatch endonuclease (patch repair protein)
MTDKLSPERRSANMSRIRSKDTKPEMVVRKLAHAMGYRYRLHRKDLPGKPDLAFGPRRKVVFVHGCFWHQHEVEHCKDGRRPKSNTAYWNAKFKRNIQRDAVHVSALQAEGWQVLTIWDCETKDLAAVTCRLAEFLGPAGVV